MSTSAIEKRVIRLTPEEFFNLKHPLADAFNWESRWHDPTTGKDHYARGVLDLVKHLCLARYLNGGNAWLIAPNGDKYIPSAAPAQPAQTDIETEMDNQIVIRHLCLARRSRSFRKLLEAILSDYPAEHLLSGAWLKFSKVADAEDFNWKAHEDLITQIRLSYDDGFLLFLVNECEDVFSESESHLVNLRETNQAFARIIEQTSRVMKGINQSE